MRTSKWFLTAALLASLSAAAQQAADPQASAQPPAPDATPPASACFGSVNMSKYGPVLVAASDAEPSWLP